MLYSFFLIMKNVGCSSAFRPRYPNIYYRTSSFAVYDRGLRKAGSWQGSDPSRSEGEAFFPCHEKSQIYLPGKSGIFIFIG